MLRRHLRLNRGDLGPSQLRHVHRRTRLSSSSSSSSPAAAAGTIDPAGGRRSTTIRRTAPREVSRHRYGREKRSYGPVTRWPTPLLPPRLI